MWSPSAKNGWIIHWTVVDTMYRYYSLTTVALSKKQCNSTSIHLLVIYYISRNNTYIYIYNVYKVLSNNDGDPGQKPVEPSEEDPLTVDVLGVALTNKTVGFAEQCDQH